MAKKTSVSKSVANALRAFVGTDRDFEINQAKIVDDFCHFSYEIIRGIGLGNPHNVKGKHIIKDELRSAFSTFNVHLAVLDGAFKLSGIEIDNIDKEHGHELTGNYIVTGFKMSGSKDNESIILIGNKYVSSAGGRMEIETPKITLDKNSSYQWFNELKLAADIAREQVALYQEGNYIPVKTEEVEDEPNRVQLSISSDISRVDDQDFANAAL